MTGFAGGRAAIAGIGATDFSKASGRTTLTLATQAALVAAADAGIDPRDIDGIVRCESDAVAHNDLATALGVRGLSFWGSTGAGGAAPCGMVGQAVAAVVSGQATHVLVFRSLNGRSGRRFGQGVEGPEIVGGDGSYNELFLPYGMVAPGQVWAMFARHHMDRYGTTHADLGAIALACRSNANANPAAQMHGRVLTAEDHATAPVISSPLRLFDYCLETDGACAAIVTSVERARDLAGVPAVIRAVAQGAPAGVQGSILFPALARADLDVLPSRLVAETLYARAGMGPGDIDVAQFYDCFTPTVLVQFEDYGFCGRGEAGPFASSGAIAAGGALPINTAGGNLSEGYIHGMNHIVEGVRQVRGTSTNQVAGAETCLVTSGLPVATSALILVQDR